jgi:ketol-acid reductoisomerase
LTRRTGHGHGLSKLAQIKVYSKLATTTTNGFSGAPQLTRGIKILDFASAKEVVYERSDYPIAKLQDYFKNNTLATVGYGSQGHGQGLNARDNGHNVIVVFRKDGESWKQAQADGWVCFFFTFLSWYTMDES